MIAPAALLVLVAVGLLAGGLARGDTAMLWASSGSGLLAALVLAAPSVVAHRWPAAARTGAPSAQDPGTPPAADPPSTGAHAVRPGGQPAADAAGEPAQEAVEVADLLLVLDATDPVVVVEGHPRYHLSGCARTAGHPQVRLPLSEARAAGFTACADCAPDRRLADRERARRS